MKKSLKKVYKNDGQDRLLPKLSLFIFDRSRRAALIWLCLTLFGILSYTTFLQRQGFPSINIPFSTITGTYLVNNAQKVDTEVAKPIGDIVLQDSHVKDVQSQAQASSYSLAIQYKDGTDVATVSKAIYRQVLAAHLPKQATVKLEVPKFGFTERGDDSVISLYTTNPTISESSMVDQANALVAFVQNKHLANLSGISIINPFVTGVNPATGKQTASQTKFDRYGERRDDANHFYNSVAIGITQKPGTDVIKLDNLVESTLAEYNQAHADTSYTAVVSATYASDIKDQISELQRALTEGLIAVLIIGSIVIAIRASLITVIAMLTVLSITLGILFIAGYTLNTITLFSLILCLGLIVDDTIIMIEAIDAQRRKRSDPREVVHVATRKVSRAMVAATSTAALSFAPLLFVGGILGSFIRAIPITVITSLVVSLSVALIFIPLFARYLILGKKQMGADNVNEPAAGIEAKVAKFIGRPIIWARNSKKRLFGVGITAMIVGLGFIVAAGMIFQKVTFNIFPPSKDSNSIGVTLNFQPNDTIAEAQATTDKADKVIIETLGENFMNASYFANASNQMATMRVNIIPYTQRSVTAPQLINKLTSNFKGFNGATVKVNQIDAGPPASAFTVRIETSDRIKAIKLADDMQKFLEGHQLTRVSGTKAKIIQTIISNPGTIARSKGKQYFQVTADFDATDTTTLVTLAQNAVNKEFTPDVLSARYGLDKGVIKYDLGEEGDNQNSFKSLAMAFPILLLVIYLLLAIQFRSLAQPLLIFMAIPFSLFGITLGLFWTHNAFSFFAMLGFFALIGLSIKNTILLTDYANQLRRAGNSAVDAVIGAIAERFRPLIATSLTAVVSLIPLALSSPFWEGLAVVLIFGLLSSTLLVLTVFPYYYLGAEYLRIRISRKACLAWLALSIISIVGAIAGGMPALAPLAPIVILILEIWFVKARRHKRQKRATR